MAGRHEKVEGTSGMVASVAGELAWRGPGCLTSPVDMSRPVVVAASSMGHTPIHHRQKGSKYCRVHLLSINHLSLHTELDILTCIIFEAGPKSVVFKCNPGVGWEGGRKSGVVGAVHMKRIIPKAATPRAKILPAL